MLRKYKTYFLNDFTSESSSENFGKLQGMHSRVGWIAITDHEGGRGIDVKGLAGSTVHVVVGYQDRKPTAAELQQFLGRSSRTLTSKCTGTIVVGGHLDY